MRRDTVMTILKVSATVLEQVVRIIHIIKYGGKAKKRRKY